MLDVCSPEGTIQRKVVAKGKWKGVPGVFVAARKSQLGGLWPYLDNHDFKDRTTELRGARTGDNFEQGDGDLELEDGEERDLEGWDDIGDGEWEPVVDVGERRVDGRRRGGRGRRGRLSKEEREIEAMFEESFR